MNSAAHDAQSGVKAPGTNNTYRYPALGTIAEGPLITN